MSRSLPNLLLIMVILAFLPSWLLVTAGPRISSARFQMNDGWCQNRVRANSPIVFPVTWITEASEAKLTLESISSNGVINRSCQPSLCERRKQSHVKPRYDLIEMGSKLDFGQCRIHAQSRLREHIKWYRRYEKNLLTVKSLMILSSFF